MSPESSTESYPEFAQIGLRENPGKNLNQVTCSDRESNPGHLVLRPDALTFTPQAGGFVSLFSVLNNVRLLHSIEDRAFHNLTELRTITAVVFNERHPEENISHRYVTDLMRKFKETGSVCNKAMANLDEASQLEILAFITGDHLNDEYFNNLNRGGLTSPSDFVLYWMNSIDQNRFHGRPTMRTEVGDSRPRKVVKPLFLYTVHPEFRRIVHTGLEFIPQLRNLSVDSILHMV
ncbi:hypothetical protein ANN_17507 [Periplaneta americana]|uniref:Uncharacterized protein n=1 Tax=Periplaneta americana TaxID=6978 RepID=A0ABQ8ST47_PERAM|nr:hypothetical protein ANN_17507 [Periplaneta americana]